MRFEFHLNSEKKAKKRDKSKPKLSKLFKKNESHYEIVKGTPVETDIFGKTTYQNVNGVFRAVGDEYPLYVNVGQRENELISLSPPKEEDEEDTRLPQKPNKDIGTWIIPIEIPYYFESLFIRIKYGEDEQLGILQPHNYRIVALPDSNYVYDEFSSGFTPDYESTGFFRKLGKLGFIIGNIFFDSSKKIITRAHREQFWIENTQEWLVDEYKNYGNSPFYKFLRETWNDKLDGKDSIYGQDMIVFQDVTGWTASYEGETYAWNLNYGYPYSLGYPFDIGRDEEGNLYLVSGRKLIFEEDFTDEYPFISIERDQYLIEEIYRPPKDWGYGSLRGVYHFTVDFRLYVYAIDKQTLKVNPEPIIEVPYYQIDTHKSYSDWVNEGKTTATITAVHCFKNLVAITLHHPGFSRGRIWVFNYLTGKKVYEVEAPGDMPNIVFTTAHDEKFITFYFYSPWKEQDFLIDEFGNCLDITGFRNDNHWDGYFIDKQRSDSKEIFIIRDTDKKLIKMITHGVEKEILAEIEVNWVNATATFVVNKLLCYRGRIFYSDYKYKDIYEVFPYFDEDTQTWKSFQQLLYDKRDGSPVKILNGYLVMSNMKTFFVGNGKFEESKLFVVPEGASSFLTKLATHDDHQFEDIVNYTWG